MLDGAPGTGKSFVTVDLAARLSRGGPLPDGQALDRPLVTRLVNPEDDPFDTVRPRAGAAGADLARLFVAPRPGAPVPQFPDGVKDLEGLVYENAADLVVPRRQLLECALLKAMAAHYVMSQPRAVAEQARERDVITELALAIGRGAPATLDPVFQPAWDGAADDAERHRVVTDQLSSLTDTSALAWHARLA